MIRRTLFGPPGTGKTTALIAEARRAMEKGLAPEQIGFVSFSRRALKEAREKMGEFKEEQLKNFRTIHATAYHMLDLRRGDVIQQEHLEEFVSGNGFMLIPSTSS